MKINLLNKSCPTCKSNIPLKIFRNREETIQCPSCKSLLIENPKRKLISSIVFFIGIFAAFGSVALRIPIYIGFLIFVIFFLIALKIIDLTTTKRDLIIRNKHTNQISFVNNSDWEEIINNSINQENNFEIVEYLK